MADVTQGMLAVCRQAVATLNARLPDFLEAFETAFDMTLPMPNVENVVIGNVPRKSTDGHWIQVYIWPGTETMNPAVIGPDYFCKSRVAANIVIDADRVEIDGDTVTDTNQIAEICLAYGEAISQAVSSYLVEDDTSKRVNRCDIESTAPSPTAMELPDGAGDVWRIQYFSITWLISRTTPFLVHQGPPP